MMHRLAGVDTCAVSDAMDQLELTSGVVAGLRPMSIPRRIAGRVITVRLEEARGRRSVNHLGTSAIENVLPGDVIVVAHNGLETVSGWGGLLSLGAALRGSVGIIIDGACRDIDEMVDLDLPVYARGATPRTARGRVIETGWNEDIVVGGVVVSPGDLAIADRTGVVFIPQAGAESVVSAAETIFAREAAMARALSAGGTMASALVSYETLLVKGNGDG